MPSQNERKFKMVVTIKELKRFFENSCKFVPTMYKSGKDINIEIKYDEIYELISRVLANYDLILIRRNPKYLSEVFTIVKK